MATRAQLRAALRVRTGDASALIWSDSDLNGFLDSAVRTLYPAFYQRQVGETIADDGPLQTMPAGARDLYFVGLRREGSNRVREVRGWREGDGEAIVPKLGVTGQTLVWAWTGGWEAPESDGESLIFPTEAQEVVLLRSHISAIESLFSNRIQHDKYISIQARQGITEDDISMMLDALHATLRDLLQVRPPLPGQQAPQAAR